MTLPWSPTNFPVSFGRYRLLREIGRGMGVVYEAEDTRLKRRIALKVARPDASDASGTHLKRFAREGRVAGRIYHPRFCPVYDFGRYDGVDFLTMPLLKGIPLSKRPNIDQPWPERVAARFIRKLALALQEMHEDYDAFHRDLKPSNIMMQDDARYDRHQEPIILDFGLARSVIGDDGVTVTPSMLGTPAYMAPEQASNSSKVGPPCDIYSLGTILYELLTGKRAYEGTYHSIIYDKTHGPLRVAAQMLRNRFPDAPPLDTHLDTICSKAMARDVGDRYKSMREMVSELDVYLQRDGSVSDEAIERERDNTAAALRRWQEAQSNLNEERQQRELAEHRLQEMEAKLEQERLDYENSLAEQQQRVAELEAKADREKKERVEAQRKLAHIEKFPGPY